MVLNEEVWILASSLLRPKGRILYRIKQELTNSCHKYLNNRTFLYDLKVAGVIVLVFRTTRSVGTDGVRDKTNNKN